MPGLTGSDLMIMRHTGNGAEVLVFHRSPEGDESDYRTFPTPEAAMGSSGFDWHDPDQSVTSVDPTAIKVAPWEHVTATPIGEATHEQRHARA